MKTNQTVVSRFGQIGKGAALAGAIAALSLTTPTPAHAGGNGVGAAIGLGILGGVLAGAAIASTTPPAYGYGRRAGLLLRAATLLRPGADLLRRIAAVLRLVALLSIEIRKYRGRENVPGLHQEAGHHVYGSMRLTICS